MICTENAQKSAECFQKKHTSPFSFPQVGFCCLPFFRSLLPPVRPPLLKSPPASYNTRNHPAMRILFHPQRLRIRTFPPPFFPGHRNCRAHRYNTAMHPFDGFCPESDDGNYSSRAAENCYVPTSDIPYTEPQSPSAQWKDIPGCRGTDEFPDTSCTAAPIYLRCRPAHAMERTAISAQRKEKESSARTLT